MFFWVEFLAVVLPHPEVISSAEGRATQRAFFPNKHHRENAVRGRLQTHVARALGEHEGTLCSVTGHACQMWL